MTTKPKRRKKESTLEASIGGYVVVDVQYAYVFHVTTDRILAYLWKRENGGKALKYIKVLPCTITYEY